MNQLLSNFARQLDKTSKQLYKLADKNSPLILTGLGIAGFVTTCVMVHQATPKANAILEAHREKEALNPKEENKVVTTLKEIKAVAPAYAPSILMGSLSASCIIGAYKINTKRLSALSAAYQITENRLREYQRKVIETVGEKKEQKIREEVSKDHLKDNPVSKNDIYPTGDGTMLCYDHLSGRYFYSSIDAIRRAERTVTKQQFLEMYVSLNDFYGELGLPRTSIGDDLGWNAEDEIEITFSSQLTDNSEPCLVLEYSIGPRWDFRCLH